MKETRADEFLPNGQDHPVANALLVFDREELTGGCE